MKLTVNGKAVDREVPAHTILLDFLRDNLRLTTVKKGCGEGECGTCTVLLNGEPVNACMMFAVQAQDAEVTTLEGVGADGGLDPVQKAFLTHYGFQCGYCTPGMILATKSLLARHPSPSREQIVEALEGNLCRCTGYQQIIESVLQAAELAAG